MFLDIMTFGEGMYLLSQIVRDEPRTPCN